MSAEKVVTLKLDNHDTVGDIVVIHMWELPAGITNIRVEIGGNIKGLGEKLKANSMIPATIRYWKAGGGEGVCNVLVETVPPPHKPLQRIMDARRTNW